jgi:hypothetical protein
MLPYPALDETVIATCLKREAITYIDLGQLKPNQYRKLSKPELSKLTDILGISL